MIRRSTWLALGALALVSLVAIVWTRARGELPDDEAGRPATPIPLWAVDSTAIRRLIVESGEGEVLLAAERDSVAGWRMREPEVAPADAGRLERAASWLASPPVRLELEAPADLTPFELDPPRYRVKIETASNEAWGFAIGRVVPTGETVYALMPGRAGIVLLSDYGVEEVLGLLDPLPRIPPTSAAASEATPTP